MKNRFLALALALPALASCTSLAGGGPAPETVRRELASVSLAPVVTAEGDVPAPSTDRPLRIGISPPLATKAPANNHFSNVVDHGEAAAFFDVWTDAERAAIDAWVARAKAAGLVAHAEYLPSVILDGEQLTLADATRGAALTRGLDAVLIARAGTTYWVDPTALSVLDFALVTTVFVPTAEFETFAVVEGAIVDARTGYVYATGAAESTDARLAPPLAGDALRYQREVRRSGVEKMISRMARGAGLEG